MAEPDDGDGLPVELLYSPAPRALWRWTGRVPAGSTLADVIEAAGFRQAHPDVALDDGPKGNVGIWNRHCALTTVVRADDRIEIWRPLIVDPKQARRERYALHLEREAMRKPRLRRPPPGA